ncbi:hypothetical protein B0T19DRAFT_449806 [Cercophora scortea]|uniref:TauD/TfdA-like domain-containing protein n=1 Tax=Cercophora scortea TaxID=314031 RepID=A0AAE0MD40_9PEZI|nr:hypothetical protein B0T19DRAFT_449806 [Cercophora scortea]
MHDWLESHPTAWVPEAFINTGNSTASPSYVVHIDEREVDEALETWKGLGLDVDALIRDNFPLPTIQAQLDEACGDIHQDRGFAIVRGLDPKKYTDEENVVLFLGIASHFGDMRGVQDKNGSMLTHITDSKDWSAPPELRHGIHTNTGLAWHTDMGIDILSLHVRSLAEKGGHTFVASSWTIYKDLVMSFPDVLEALQTPNWSIQISGNPPRYILAPLLQVFGHQIYISFDPGRLGVHPVTAKSDLASTVPSLTPRQYEALEVLSRLATKHRLALDTRPGDMVFINNWATVHARDSYIDPDNGTRRHLVRLWQRNSKLGWAIPESMRVPWETAFKAHDDSLSAACERKYPVVPAREYKIPRYTAGSAAFMLEDGDDVNGGGADE